MKIIIVGASGRIGREVDKALSNNHDIVRVGIRRFQKREEFWVFPNRQL